MYKPLHVRLCVCVCVGETGAAHLLLSVRHLPVQQRQGERGPPRSGEDLLCVVAAETSQPHSEEHAVLLTLRDRTSAPFQPRVLPEVECRWFYMQPKSQEDQGHLGIQDVV